MESEKTDEPEVEETHFDRRKKYRELVAGGMPDREASEKVWPTSAATIMKNVRDKKDREEKAEKDKKSKE